MYLPHVWPPEDEFIILHDSPHTIADEEDWLIVDDTDPFPVTSWPFPFVRNAAPKTGKKTAPAPVTAPTASPAARGRRAQRGVEFLVVDATGIERPFRTFNDAAGVAVGLAASSGKPVHLDVLVMSRDGAAERIQIQAKSDPRGR